MLDETPAPLPATAVGCTTDAAAAAAANGGWAGDSDPQLVALDALCCSAPIEGASAYVLLASSGGSCASAEAALLAAVRVAGVESSLRPTIFIFGGVPYYGISSCNETKAWDGATEQVVAKVGLASRKAAQQVVDLVTVSGVAQGCSTTSQIGSVPRRERGRTPRPVRSPPVAGPQEGGPRRLCRRARP